MIPLNFPLRAGLLGSILLVLAGCAPAPTRPAGGGGAAGQAGREATLAALDRWSFAGRVAIDSAGKGGNARIEWSQRGDDFEVRLSAPVTRQSWRLVRQGGMARIEGLEEGVRQGKDAEQLLHEATGWEIPVDALASWVRGARSDPAAASLEYSAAGLPAVLLEAGWTVEYRAWAEGTPALPTRLFARRGEASVRLAIESWSTP